ncbi:MAG: hypothetical protein AAB768_00530 [Patescibacteria group bacterium]
MTKRIFLGIGIDLKLDDLHAKLSAFNKHLDWIPDQDLHIPLNYLGRLLHQDINAVGITIKTIVEKYQPFTLKPQYLETLYKKHEESQIYVSLAGQVDILSQLQKELAKNLDEVAAQPKRYFPYLTVATLKKTDHETTKQILNKISGLDLELNIDEFQVNKITLYENLFHRDSVTYQKIRDFVLE